MSSGIAINDDCVTKFNELKLSKNTRYIVFKVSDDKSSIVVESSAPLSANYADFLKVLPEKDCRFAVYDFEWDHTDGKRSKITFIQWSPDVAPIKSKMTYSASKDAFRKKLVGIASEVQATDSAEISYDQVKEKVSRDVR